MEATVHHYFSQRAEDMKIYIRGLGNISPQLTFNNKEFLEEIVDHEGNHLSVIAPPYKEYIHPRKMRRMTKIIRMGVAAAKICMQDAGLETPDAIVSGTAMGCVQDTEKFLLAFGSEESDLLTPTSFIQSTHNTVGSQIALHMGCQNYNFTYVHRGFSFEHALMDAILLIKEGEMQNVLVGGIEEATDFSFKVKKELSLLKENVASNLGVISMKSKGIVVGEAATFFLMTSEENTGNYAELKGLRMGYAPKSTAETVEETNRLLGNNNLDVNDVDVVILGMNGNENDDVIYEDYIKTLPETIPVLVFKPLCGEFETASSFALWMAAKIIKEQRVPKTTIVRGDSTKTIKNILIYNHFQNRNHSLMLVSQC